MVVRAQLLCAYGVVSMKDAAVIYSVVAVFVVAVFCAYCTGNSESSLSTKLFNDFHLSRG